MPVFNFSGPVNEQFLTHTGNTGNRQILGFYNQITLVFSSPNPGSFPGASVIATAVPLSTGFGGRGRGHREGSLWSWMRSRWLVVVIL